MSPRLFCAKFLAFCNVRWRKGVFLKEKDREGTDAQLSLPSFCLFCIFSMLFLLPLTTIPPVDLLVSSHLLLRILCLLHWHLYNSNVGWTAPSVTVNCDLSDQQHRCRHAYAATAAKVTQWTFVLRSHLARQQHWPPGGGQASGHDCTDWILHLQH